MVPVWARDGAGSTQGTAKKRSAVTRGSIAPARGLEAVRIPELLSWRVQGLDRWGIGRRFRAGPLLPWGLEAERPYTKTIDLEGGNLERRLGRGLARLWARSIPAPWGIVTRKWARGLPKVITSVTGFIWGARLAGGQTRLGGD